MNYKKILVAYIQSKLSELSDVDDYDAIKCVLFNLRWFLNFTSSNEVIEAKLKVMIDADKKRKKYLERFEGMESEYYSEYSEAESKLGKECIRLLERDSLWKRKY